MDCGFIYMDMCLGKYQVLVYLRKYLGRYLLLKLPGGKLEIKEVYT